MSLTTAGESPSDTSSHSSRSGLDISAAADRDHLLLAAARARSPGCDACSFRTGKQRVDRRPASIALAPREGADPQVFLDGEPAKQTPALRHHRYSVAHDFGPTAARPISSLLKRIWPLFVGHLPGDRLQEGRLAGAVGADQRDDAALLEFEIDSEQRLEIAVARVEVTGSAASRPPRPRCPCRRAGLRGSPSPSVARRPRASRRN